MGQDFGGFRKQLIIRDIYTKNNSGFSPIHDSLNYGLSSEKSTFIANPMKYVSRSLLVSLIPVKPRIAG